MVRITSVVVSEPNLKAYLEHVQRPEIAEHESAPGLIAIWLIRRPCVAYVELMTVSL
jgi:hypothetical protein